MKLLMATTNKHKINEILRIFDEFIPGKMELLSLEDVLDNMIEVEETGATFEENAKIKAQTYYKLSQIACFAEDSGLEIDALDGAPGVFSARFAGVQGEHPENRRKALRLLENVPLEKRTARYRAVICYCDQTGTYFFDDSVEGKIGFEERGTGGFGYDPVFIPDEYLRIPELAGKTFAEISAEEKHRISHRGKAVMKLIYFLRDNN